MGSASERVTLRDSLPSCRDLRFVLQSSGIDIDGTCVGLYWAWDTARMGSCDKCFEVSTCARQEVFAKPGRRKFSPQRRVEWHNGTLPHMHLFWNESDLRTSTV